MKSKGKYIGISNRVKFDVIESSLYHYLQFETIDKEFYLRYIKEFTKGDNRAHKTLNHLTTLLNKNESIIKQLKKSLNGVDYFQLNINDRKAFVLCLFCLTYPIAFEILTTFAVGFKVQEKINRQVILQKIGSIYGGNRAMQLAVEEVIPMLIECGTIERVKIGMYSLGKKLEIKNNFISELVIYTDIKLSSTKSILIDDLMHKPWYSYFDISSITLIKFDQLVSKKDSAIGRGYLTITE